MGSMGPRPWHWRRRLCFALNNDAGRANIFHACSYINAHFFTSTIVGCPISSSCMTRVPGYEGHGFGKSPIAMANAVLQTERILRCLRLSEVRHLDLKCRNMAISSNGTLGLFDHDISVMDGSPKSGQIKSRFNHHRRIHDYEQHARRRFKLCLGYVDTSKASYQNDRRLCSGDS